MRPTTSLRSPARPVAFRPALRNPAARRQNGARALSDVGRYLNEAIQHVFQTEQAKDVQWKGTSFDGKISHDDHARLRKIQAVLKQSREGTDTEQLAKEVADAAVDGKESKAVREYLQGAVEKAFNTKESSEPSKWHLTPYSGDITTQREIQRLIWVENLVRKTMDESKMKDNA